MKTIISRSLETTCKKVSIIISIIIGFFVATMTYNSIGEAVNVSFDSFITDLLQIQDISVLFIFGTLVMIFAASNGTGIIAGENADGTLRLLVAKPNSRSEILLGKLIGTFAGCFLLYCIMLFVYYTTMMIASKYDGVILYETIKCLPGYLAYGIVAIFIILAISTLLSCVLKKRILALLPVLALIVLIIAYFPLSRIIAMYSMSSSTNEFIDLNYHLSLIFEQCMQLSGGMRDCPSETMVLLTKLYTIVESDKDITTYAIEQIVKNDSLNGLAVTIVYLLGSIGCYIGSFAIFKRKDI